MDLRGLLPVHATKRYDTRPLEKVVYLVIHHSGVDVDSSAESIARYHVGSLGWPGIGYTFVVRQNGDVEQCWDLDVMSYHVAGYNDFCLGICLPGDWNLRMPPVAQLQATRGLIARLHRTFYWRTAVVGHYEVAKPESPTSCPGSTWPQWREVLG